MLLKLLMYVCLFIMVAGCNTMTAVEEEIEINQEIYLDAELIMKSPFTDVSPEYWAFEAIAALYETSVAKGFSDNRFLPDDLLTEAQFIVFLAHFYSPFATYETEQEEVAGDWADRYYEDFSSLGIVLLGQENEEKKHLPVDYEVVSSTFSMLYNENPDIGQALKEYFSPDSVSRASFMNLLYQLQQQELDTLNQEHIVALEEEYRQALKEEKQKAQEKKENELAVKKEQEEKERIEQEAARKVEEKKQAEQIEQTNAIAKETVAPAPTITATSPGVNVINMLLPEKNSRPRTVEPTYVMIHFMSNALNKPQDPYHIHDIKALFLNYGVSAHYVIGRNGEIYHFVGEERVAFHAGKGDLPGFPQYKDKMNDHSIGIELLGIGTKEEMLAMIPGFPYDLIAASDIGYTAAQYEALNRLLQDIYKRTPTIPKNRNHVIGHDEYSVGRKTDPGSLFDWSKIGF